MELPPSPEQIFRQTVQIILMIKQLHYGKYKKWKMVIVKYTEGKNKSKQERNED
jgi:hypothetical protein